MSRIRLSLLLAAAALVACSDSAMDPSPQAPVGNSNVIEITPNPIQLKIGETTQLHVKGMHAGLVAVWESDNPSIALVAAGGFVRGVLSGSTQVSIRTGYATAKALVIVTGGN